MAQNTSYREIFRKILPSVLSDKLSTKRTDYRKEWGHNSALQIGTADESGERVVFQVQRALQSEDIEGGALIPVCRQEIAERDGEYVRLTTLTLNHRAAEALYELLKPCLKDAQRLRRQERFYQDFLVYATSFPPETEQSPS